MGNEQIITPPQSLLDYSAGPVPIRSCDHYAGKIDLLKKAFALQRKLGAIFDITCDLEDGAAVGQEREHLSDVVALLASSENHFRASGIRVHGPTTEFWKFEIDEIVNSVGEIISHITIPKARDAKDAEMAIRYIAEVCTKNGIKRNIPLHVLIETPGALRDVWKIAALPSLRCIDFGLMDFVSSHFGVIPFECMQSPGQFEHALIVRAKAEICAAAIANNIVASHNVTIDFRNVSRTTADARIAKSLFGFMRMWSVHPNQIAPIVEVFKPDTSEIEKANSVLMAAQKANWAPVSLDGILFDRANYRYFWNVLQRAEISGAEAAGRNR
jgi:citrate lyase subunit beta / citryl-CoA lyase